jgi:hypothetical protein
VKTSFAHTVYIDVNICTHRHATQVKRLSLSQVTHSLVNTIMERAKQGKHYGVILLPEVSQSSPMDRALTTEGGRGRLG